MATDRRGRDTGGVDENAPALHPAEHRAYRELYVACRQLSRHWSRIESGLAGSEVAGALGRGREAVETLLAELRPRIGSYGLHLGPAAGGLGARLADTRSLVIDRVADTGAVVRLAVLDIEHVGILLAHLGELARARDDRELAAFCDRWDDEISHRLAAVRDVAVALGGDPERTAAPLESSLLGRAAHGAGWAIGALGEAVDRAAARRR